MRSPDVAQGVPPSLSDLNERQRQVMRAVQDYFDDHNGMPPSVRDVARTLKISWAWVSVCVSVLCDKGWLRRLPGTARGLMVLHRLPEEP